MYANEGPQIGDVNAVAQYSLEPIRSRPSFDGDKLYIKISALSTLVTDMFATATIKRFRIL